MDKNTPNVHMKYEGGTSAEPEWCVWTFQGIEYRAHYRTICEMVDILHRYPPRLKADILFWVSMIFNPD